MKIRYSLLLINVIFERLAGVKYLTKLDLKEKYY